MTEPGTKTVVIHIDDVGMCHGANQAFVELSRGGFATSGSVMVPCPWFHEIAEIAAADHSLDVGVHLTLNAEKDHYKWRPLTAPPASARLTDDHGFFFPDVASTRKAEPEAVEAELRAQVDAALAAGIPITHFDAHMGSTLAPEFCAIYLRLGQEHGVPVLFTRDLWAYGPSNHLEGADVTDYDATVVAAEAAGNPIFDAVLETNWSRTPDEPNEPIYQEIFGAIGEGLTFLALHANAPGELEHIEPESAHIRADEYSLFSDAGFLGWLDDQGFDRVGFRELTARGAG